MQMRKLRAPIAGSPQVNYPQWCNKQGQIAVAFSEGPRYVLREKD
jgi:hypothetical protein